MDPLHVAALTTAPLFIWYFWSRGFNRCSSENEFMSRFEFSPLWFWFCSLILVLVGSLFRFWSHLTKLKHAADRNHPLLLQIWASCQNVSCDFCIYFFISLLFYVQRWTDFEASSTTRGDVCCMTCLIFDRLPDYQAECPVWLPLHYSFWHYVRSSDFCLLFCSRHQSFRNSSSTSCFPCLSQLMSCQNRCLKL